MRLIASAVLWVVISLAWGSLAFAVDNNFPRTVEPCPPLGEKTNSAGGKDVSANVIAFRLKVDNRYQRNGDAAAAHAAIDEYLAEQTALSGADRAGLLNYKGSLAVEAGEWAAAETWLVQALAEPELTLGMRSLIAAELKKIYGVTKQYEKLIALTERADLISYEWNLLVDATGYFFLSDYETTWCTLKQISPAHRKVSWYSLLNATAVALGRELVVSEFLAVELAKAKQGTTEAMELTFWQQQLPLGARLKSEGGEGQRVELSAPALLFVGSQVQNPYREKQHSGRVCATYVIGADGVPTAINVLGGVALHTKKYVAHDLASQRYFAQKISPMSSRQQSLKSCYSFNNGLSISSQGLDL